MRNLKITIEYDGTNYLGWQIQRSRQHHPPGSRSKTIQETLEKALAKILQEKVKLIASGRTDAGVHALAQVANFTSCLKIGLKKLRRAVNANLPDDIKVSKIEEVPLGFHSRFDAKSKIYRYTILNRNYPSALLRDKVYFYPYPLNIKLMRQASSCLLGRHDFKSFCASGSGTKNTIRTIKRITTKRLLNTQYSLPSNQKGLPLVAIEMEADGFLYKMVRNIVGTLLEVGRAKFKKGAVKKILLGKDRKLAGPAVPAKGLLLVKVNY